MKYKNMVCLALAVGIMVPGASAFAGSVEGNYDSESQKTVENSAAEISDDSTGVEKGSKVMCGDSMDDKPISVEEQLRNLPKNRRAQAERKFKEDERQRKLEESSDPAVYRSPSLATASGSIYVPYFKQERNYWCGPATVKQTVHSIKGASASQLTIANAIGTKEEGSVLAYMVNYINKQQTRNTYILVQNPSEARIQSNVKAGVDGKAPAICRLRFTQTSTSNWPYSTRGHYLNASGYSNYGRSITLTDPYLGWKKTTVDGKYNVYSSELHTATTNHPAKQMSY